MCLNLIGGLLPGMGQRVTPGRSTEPLDQITVPNQSHHCLTERDRVAVWYQESGVAIQDGIPEPGGI